MEIPTFESELQEDMEDILTSVHVLSLNDTSQKQTKIEKLKLWLGIHDTHYIKNNSPYYGLFPHYEIQKNDVILSIPRHHMLTYEDVYLKDLEGQFNSTDVNYYFVLFFYLEMRKGNSTWNPYFQTTTTKTDNYLINITKEDLALLNTTSFPFMINLKNMKRHMYQNFKILYRYLDETYQLMENHVGNYSSFFELMTYFKIIVDSRLFSYFDYEGIHRVERCAMIPYADCINHSNTENASWRFNCAKGNFEIFAIDTIPLNSEIVISYGTVSNVNLLANYGFTLYHNQYSKLVIPYENTHLIVDVNSECPADEELIDELKQIKKRHLKTLTKKMKNNYIRQIFNDEIHIITVLLAKQRSS